MTTTAVAPIVRSSHGLVDALFDSIDRLNRKEIDSEHARAVSHSAKTIVSVARLELDYRKSLGDPATAQGKLLSLTIDNPAK